MNSSEMLQEYTLHVIESCKTREQFFVAKRYADLAIKRIYSLNDKTRFGYMIELMRAIAQKHNQFSVQEGIYDKERSR